MDVDNNDVDQILLQQFSCMGTTDRDELIKQLQMLIGNALNDTTAAFFLDMNNWNLQGAICSYFDFESPNRLPSMMILQDISVNEGESIPPCTNFEKSWRVQNNGDVSWPPGTCLRCCGGDNLATADHLQVLPVSVGCTTDLALAMVSPQPPGVYQSKWRMATSNGTYFGDVLWAIVTVAEGATMAMCQQVSPFVEFSSSRDMDETSSNSYVSANRPPSQPLFQDSVQQTQDGDVNMC